jgi:hypothetical protein
MRRTPDTYNANALATILAKLERNEDLFDLQDGKPDPVREGRTDMRKGLFSLFGALKTRSAPVESAHTKTGIIAVDLSSPEVIDITLPTGKTKKISIDTKTNDKASCVKMLQDLSRFAKTVQRVKTKKSILYKEALLKKILQLCGQGDEGDNGWEVIPSGRFMQEGAILAKEHNGLFMQFFQHLVRELQRTLQKTPFNRSHDIDALEQEVASFISHPKKATIHAWTEVFEKTEKLLQVVEQDRVMGKNPDDKRTDLPGNPDEVVKLTAA